MALDVGGRFAEAERAYEWLRAHAARRRLVARVLRRRRGQGAHARHQRHLLRRERRVAPLPRHRRHRLPRSEFWPIVERAIDFALDHQHPTGEIEWGADPTRDGKGALLTGSSSIYSACGARSRSPSGSAASAPTGSCRSARSPSRSRTGPSVSSTRTAGRWTGTTRSSAACCAATPRERAHRRRAGTRSSSPGRGVRCVSDQPWVTAAETCELVMALDAIGAARPRPRRCSPGCSSCATTTAATGPA